MAPGRAAAAGVASCTRRAIRVSRPWQEWQLAPANYATLHSNLAGRRRRGDQLHTAGYPSQSSVARVAARAHQFCDPGSWHPGGPRPPGPGFPAAHCGPSESVVCGSLRTPFCAFPDPLASLASPLPCHITCFNRREACSSRPGLHLSCSIRWHVTDSDTECALAMPAGEMGFGGGGGGGGWVGRGNGS